MRNTILQKLEDVKNKYKGKHVHTGETNIYAMVNDCINHIAQLERQLDIHRGEDGALPDYKRLLYQNDSYHSEIQAHKEKIEEIKQYCLDCLELMENMHQHSEQIPKELLLININVILRKLEEDQETCTRYFDQEDNLAAEKEIQKLAVDKKENFFQYYNDQEE